MRAASIVLVRIAAGHRARLERGHTDLAGWVEEAIIGRSSTLLLVMALCFVVEAGAAFVLAVENVPFEREARALRQQRRGGVGRRGSRQSRQRWDGRATAIDSGLFAVLCLHMCPWQVCHLSVSGANVENRAPFACTDREICPVLCVVPYSGGIHFLILKTFLVK